MSTLLAGNFCFINRKNKIHSVDHREKLSASSKIKQLPLRHIDNLNMSISRLTNIEVKIEMGKAFKNLFQLSGEFPTFVTNINSNDERIKDVDMKLGDFIIAINNLNVSRASVKSVKKIIKSSRILRITLARPPVNQFDAKKNSNRTFKTNTFSETSPNVKENNVNSSCGRLNNDEDKVCSMETRVKLDPRDDTIDYGYFSIPSVASFDNKAHVENDWRYSVMKANSQNDINLRKISKDVEEFLGKIQNLIQIYVRPCIVLNILTMQQSLTLFQNLEKLIPVTKFMLNIFESFKLNPTNLPTSETLNIVFESFKIYLNGLPKAVHLLSSLMHSNYKFMSFLEKANDVYSLQILDLLFMPLKVVQLIIEMIKNMIEAKCDNSKDTDNKISKLKVFLTKLYELYKKVEIYLEKSLDVTCESLLDNESYETKDVSKQINSITSVTDYSCSSDSEESELNISLAKKISILIQQTTAIEKPWQRALLILNSNGFKIESKHFNLNLNDIVYVEKSLHRNQVYFRIKNQLWPYDDKCSMIRIELDSFKLRDHLFDLTCRLMFQKH